MGRLGGLFWSYTPLISRFTTKVLRHISLSQVPGSKGTDQVITSVQGLFAGETECYGTVQTQEGICGWTSTQKVRFIKQGAVVVKWKKFNNNNV